jgi:hypothetical protein
MAKKTAVKAHFTSNIIQHLCSLASKPIKTKMKRITVDICWSEMYYRHDQAKEVTEVSTISPDGLITVNVAPDVAVRLSVVAHKVTRPLLLEYNHLEQQIDLLDTKITQLFGVLYNAFPNEPRILNIFKSSPAIKSQFMSEVWEVGGFNETKLIDDEDFNKLMKKALLPYKNSYEAMQGELMRCQLLEVA